MKEFGRLFLRIAGACVLIGAIFYAGWTMGTSTSQAGRGMACFAYSSYIGAYAEYMYQEGNYNKAREALLQAVAVYGDLRGKETDAMFKDIYAREMIVAYGRLAAIEKKKKDSQEMQRFIKEAIKLCPQQTYFRDACMTGDALQKMIRGLDRRYE